MLFESKQTRTQSRGLVPFLALEQRIRKQNTKLILIKKDFNYFRRSINRTEDKNRDSFLFILKFNNKGQAIGFLMDS